ncbi:unnamed protein product [Blepharisma stoltei]|uniref:Myb-like DNA-binding domain containing protein n=1 Tax=Blepharisma stoltei TaxID=1481888 RepID=A0AAU9IL63_9CILI|nr:unnamed protein product [Blepharisma stoltei]
MESTQQKFKFSTVENLENSSLATNFDLLYSTGSQSPSADTTSTDFSDDQQDFDDPSFMLYFSSSNLQSLSPNQYKDTYLESPPSPMSEKQARCRRIRKSKSKRWTADEDKLLVDLYFQYALDWKTIAKLIPGRAADAVKNRFYGVIKKNASFSDQNRFNMAAKKARESKASSYQIVVQDYEQIPNTDSFLFCEHSNNTLLGKSITEFQKDLENDASSLTPEAKINYLNTLKQKAEKLEEMLKEVKGMLNTPN